jgi:hypothetical protein
MNRPIARYDCTSLIRITADYYYPFVGGVMSIEVLIEPRGLPHRQHGDMRRRGVILVLISGRRLGVLTNYCESSHSLRSLNLGMLLPN